MYYTYSGPGQAVLHVLRLRGANRGVREAGEKLQQGCLVSHHGVCATQARSCQEVILFMSVCTVCMYVCIYM